MGNGYETITLFKHSFVGDAAMRPTPLHGSIVYSERQGFVLCSSDVAATQYVRKTIAIDPTLPVTSSMGSCWIILRYE